MVTYSVNLNGLVVQIPECLCQPPFMTQQYPFTKSRDYYLHQTCYKNCNFHVPLYPDQHRTFPIELHQLCADSSKATKELSFSYRGAQPSQATVKINNPTSKYLFNDIFELRLISMFTLHDGQRSPLPASLFFTWKSKTLTPQITTAQVSRAH